MKWGEKEAELAELAEATNDVREAVREATAPLPEDAQEREAAQRERIERLMRDAASWGFRLAQRRPNEPPPKFEIDWDGDLPLLMVRSKDSDPLSARTQAEVDAFLDKAHRGLL
ncbi:hypothetical protein Airi01_087840 [Actinoallomurus iriomotensis]|uniref:Uncharacterized protein n=1 Tax=Actinoallomurus iriomotensis TaxID=478107 RepID=A0A9W6RUR4_9ACTN|nr:hypothetical protein Airi01_087840 [Actinoallomurus iriomotensis]